MIKNFLILFIIVMSVITGYVVYLKTKPQPIGFINNNITLPERIKEPKQDEIGLQIINEINLKNKEIKNFTCKNIIVYTWYKGLRLKLDGSIDFEKPLNLKMDVKSIVGREFIMGSNDDEFWFCSRRLTPPSLYFAKHADYQKTRLKSAFNPLMIMDSLGFNEINVDKNVAVKQINDDVAKIALIEKTINSIGEPIGHITFIDKNNKRLLGHLVTDDKGSMIASSEILEYKNDLPYQILYTWYEEDQAMLIELPDSEINTDMSKNNWTRPHHKQEINMGETTVDLKWDFKE